MDASSSVRAVIAIRVVPADLAIKNLGGLDNCNKTILADILPAVSGIVRRRGEVVDGNLAAGMVFQLPSNTIAVHTALDLAAYLAEKWGKQFLLAVGIHLADFDSNGRPPHVPQADCSDIAVAVSLMKAARNGLILMTRAAHNNARIGLLDGYVSRASSRPIPIQWHELGACECSGIHGSFTVFASRLECADSWPDPHFGESLRLSAAKRPEIVVEGDGNAQRIIEQFSAFQSFIDQLHFEPLLGNRSVGSKEERRERVNAVLRATLGEAEKVISLLGHCKILCSIKVKTSPKKFRCIYPPHEEFRGLKTAIENLNINHSYSGMAFAKDEHLFVPDFATFPEDRKAKWTQAVQDQIALHKIKGVIVFPIRVTLSDGRRPRGVLKVDLFEANGIVENALSTSTVCMVANQIGLVWQRESLVGLDSQSEKPAGDGEDRNDPS